MEKEPLIPYVNPRIHHSSLSPPPPQSPLSLCPLPEDDEIILPPYPLTPSEFKDHLIFGTPPSTSSSSILVDSLNAGLNSPRRSSSLDPNFNCFSEESSNLEANQSQPSWLTDPNIPWSKGSLHRCKTAPAMAVINDFHHSSGSNHPPQSNSSSIVRQAVLLLILYLALGVGIYSVCRENFKGQETYFVVDALYFCIVTMCTIGYGDITPDSTSTKLFSIMFVLVGFGFIDILLSAMVGYVLDLQENYLLRTLKAGGARDAGRFVIDVKKGRMRIRMKVALALGVVVICIGIGVAFMHYVEMLGWLDSFYLSVMSVTTVGYGDRAFNSLPGRIFASIWLLVSTLAVARAFLYLAEARVDKRHRTMAKWVLHQSMTVSQFLAADIDNNGFVSKSEYVIYKLKEMGKVTEKDVLLISKQFERLDKGNFGKITLADLGERHH